MAETPRGENPNHEDPPKIVPATRTRPGGVGRTAFYILLASLALVMIAWLALEIWAYTGSPVP